MPDAPPGRDYEQAAVGREVCEEGCSQQQDKAQSGVLDAGLDRKGAAVLLGDPEGGADTVPDHEGHEIMDEDHQEDVFDTLEESIHIACEGQDDHGNEKEDGNPLERLLEESGHLGQEPGGQDAGDQRNAQQELKKTTPASFSQLTGVTIYLASIYLSDEQPLSLFCIKDRTIEYPLCEVRLIYRFRFRIF